MNGKCNDIQHLIKYSMCNDITTHMNRIYDHLVNSRKKGSTNEMVSAIRMYNFNKIGYTIQLSKK